MKFSDLFGRSGQPAQTATFTTAVTESVVTASPAIFLGVNCAVTEGDNSTITCDTYSGTTLINRNWANPTAAGFSESFVPSSAGIDCPSGISITITSYGAGPSNPKVNVYYILK